MKIKDYKIKNTEIRYGACDDSSCPKVVELKVTTEGTLNELVDEIIEKTIAGQRSGADHPFFLHYSPTQKSVDEKSKTAAFAIQQEHGGGASFDAQGVYGIKVNGTKGICKLLEFKLFDQNLTDPKYIIDSVKGGVIKYHQKDEPNKIINYEGLGKLEEANKD